MDKYEYNLKLEEIDKLVDQGSYEDAAKLADTIDWRRVRNIRTLCLISEIYEATGRFEDSKSLLVRAYKRSPVGRTVLYRLVEVTTALKEYDEAIEYYSEYVQVAPHDNNRYILKYKIYKGRGSQPEELIAILEEYLSQEYTERWAYELASLYQQTGQMQKCYATCDDLVLWFHSGKYVKKALELKKRYTALTPKQQQIYEECQQEEKESRTAKKETGTEQDASATVLQEIGGTDGDVLAESIIVQTEKEIADQVTAHRAEMEKQDSPAPSAKESEPPAAVEKAEQSEETGTMDQEEHESEGQEASELPTEEPAGSAEMEATAEGIVNLTSSRLAAAVEDILRTRIDPAAVQQLEKPGNAAGVSEGNPGAGEVVSSDTKEAAAISEKSAEEAAKEPERVQIKQPQEPDSDDVKDFHAEMAKSMRKIISGIVKQREEDDADLPASMDPKLQTVPRLEMPELREPVTSQLTIDDILLSMSDQGKKIADAVIAAEEARAEEEKREKERAEAEALALEEARAREAEEQTEEQAEDTKRIIPKSVSYELTDAEKEALRYTNHPERLLRNRDSLPSYTEEDSREPAKENLEKTKRVPSKEELKAAAEKEILAEKTIRIPAETVREAMDGQSDAAKKAEKPLAEPEFIVEDVAIQEAEIPGVPREAETPSEVSQEAQEASPKAEVPEEPSEEKVSREADSAADYSEELEDDQEYLTIPEHLRPLFEGFVDVDGLEDQIANAIIQAEAKGTDRTSRTGNILIFGGHGSGKTTLAMSIAKAIAQDKGSQSVKVARIYAADLNRRDIAATVAKIAGGTLIIEEAGDLESGVIEQLTTAMEFRTDGLVVILEDEQKYIHELLMKHPRFTMKFTAQIYIPVYTVDELAGFGQIYAKAQDYIIGQEAYSIFCEKISALATEGKEVTIIDVLPIVDRAISRSNKFFRKMSMGKKRYDEENYVVLYPKDMK